MAATQVKTKTKNKTKNKNKTKANTKTKSDPNSRKNSSSGKERKSSSESKKKTSRGPGRRLKESSEKKTKSEPEGEDEPIWDPEVSYVHLSQERPKQKLGKLGPERKLWKTKGSPIHDRAKIPDEWNWDDREPDLASDDIDGHVKRCKERIEAGILPIKFEMRLKEWENKKLGRETIQARYPDKSFEVAQRLDELYAIKAALPKEDDDYKQIPNIEALIKAYESGELEWYDGLVTYWSYGKQLCKPRPLNDDELLRVNRKHGGHESFWAEGTTYSLKLLGASDASALELEFVEDTGAALMNLYGSDIPPMHASSLNNGDTNTMIPPVLGVIRCELADSTFSLPTPVILVMVNMRRAHKSKEFVLPQWTTVQALVGRNPIPGRMNIRLGGPWLRKMMFTVTVPDGMNDLLVFDLEEGIDQIRTACQGVPKDPGQRPGPAYLKVGKD